MTTVHVELDVGEVLAQGTVTWHQRSATVDDLEVTLYGRPVELTGAEEALVLRELVEAAEEDERCALSEDLEEREDWLLEGERQ
jgi:hypothetical protein